MQVDGVNLLLTSVDVPCTVTSSALKIQLVSTKMKNHQNSCGVNLTLTRNRARMMSQRMSQKKRVIKMVQVFQHKQNHHQQHKQMDWRRLLEHRAKFQIQCKLQLRLNFENHNLRKRLFIFC